MRRKAKSQGKSTTTTTTKKNIQTQRLTHWRTQKSTKNTKQKPQSILKDLQVKEKIPRPSVIRQITSKVPQSLFCVTIYCWMWSLALREVCILSRTPLERTSFPFVVRRALNLIKYWLFTATSFMPLMYLHIFHAVDHFRAKDLLLG